MWIHCFRRIILRIIALHSHMQFNTFEFEKLVEFSDFGINRMQVFPLFINGTASMQLAFLAIKMFSLFGNRLEPNWWKNSFCLTRIFNYNRFEIILLASTPGCTITSRVHKFTIKWKVNHIILTSIVFARHFTINQPISRAPSPLSKMWYHTNMILQFQIAMATNSRQW